MGFEFSSRMGIQSQVREIAAQQVDKALKEVALEDADFVQTVHKARRHCKRLRGLLRLVEPRFKRFADENWAIRDAMNLLAGSRDAAVMLETMEALAQFDGEKSEPRMEPALIDAVRLLLEQRIQTLPEAAAQRGLLEPFSQALIKIGERVGDWSIKGHGFRCLGDGLEETYRRMRQEMAFARRSPNADALHEWRKHTKYHWHHVGLLQAAAPQMLEGRQQLLDQLAETLGDHHNLAVLDQALCDERGPIAEADISVVRHVIGERQAMLAEQAFTLGQQLVAEKPSSLRARFAKYWALLPAEK